MTSKGTAQELSPVLSDALINAEPFVVSEEEHCLTFLVKQVQIF